MSSSLSGPLRLFMMRGSSHLYNKTGLSIWFTEIKGRYRKGEYKYYTDGSKGLLAVRGDVKTPQ